MDLSYFKLSLINYLKESFPELVDQENIIEERSIRAATKYEESIKEGLHHDIASETANKVLFEGLAFSKYDMIKDILREEFFQEVDDDKVDKLALELLSECESLFSKYHISDDFNETTEHIILYTEITGLISYYLESHGL